MFESYFINQKISVNTRIDTVLDKLRFKTLFTYFFMKNKVSGATTYNLNDNNQRKFPQSEKV